MRNLLKNKSSIRPVVACSFCPLSKGIPIATGYPSRSLPPSRQLCYPFLLLFLSHLCTLNGSDNRPMNVLSLGHRLVWRGKRGVEGEMGMGGGKGKRGGCPKKEAAGHTQLLQFHNAPLCYQRIILL